MKITAIRVYQVDLPLVEGKYTWADGKSVEVFDSTVVEVMTDEGITGVGEVCPLGPAYLPAYAEGARTGIRELAPHLLGQDPRQLSYINKIMDKAMRGHPYVKSALDVACWDILGKYSKLPVCVLLGGRYGDKYPLYRAISQGTPEEMTASVAKYRDEGYRKFQLKVGGDVTTDCKRILDVAKSLKPTDVLMCDANTGWLMHEAMQVVHAVRNVEGPLFYLEQPCDSYEENVSVRRLCHLPFILDENIDSLQQVLRLFADKAADAINLKISKVGGLTKARQIRDLCVSIGLAMNIEDTWGGDVVTAAISHLAHSTPPDYLLASTDFNSYVTTSIADGAPHRENGFLSASTQPGLGVQLKHSALKLMFEIK